MIKVLESNSGEAIKVRFSYDGDSLSDYESSIIVKTGDKKTAISRAKEYLSNSTKYDNPRFFRIDSIIGSLSDYKKRYPHSNIEIIDGR